MVLRNGFYSHLLSYIICIAVIPNSQSANVTQTPSIVCTDPFSSLPNGFSIEFIAGDYTVSLLTSEHLTLTGINLDSLNELLNGTNSKLGVRIIRVTDLSTIASLLLSEVQFLQECATNPIAILVMDELWSHVVSIANAIDYTIWKLPGSSTVLFPKIARILYELPWTQDDPVIDVKSDDVDLEMEFLEASRREQLCLGNSDLERTSNVRVALGGREIRKSVDHHQNADFVTVAVPLFADDFAIVKSLPDGSYIFSDNDELSNTSRVSTVFIIASTLHRLAQHIVQSHTNCSIMHVDTSDNCRHPDNWNLDDLNALVPSNDGLSETFWPTSYTEPNVVLVNIIKNPLQTLNSKRIASINVLNNVTTIYHYRQEESSHHVGTKLGVLFHCENRTSSDSTINIYDSTTEDISREMYWRIKPEVWVAIGLTLSVLGVLITFAIFVFVLVRLYLEDVLEGNPVGTIALLISLILLFTSFIPFAVEHTSDRHIVDKSLELEVPVALCSVRVLFVTVCYCFTFSLILCRTLMLASIGSEGGFLSHVNGYIQSVICVFSALVQVGMSTQLLIVMSVARESISCDRIYYGNWFWVLLAYDMLLLGAILLLTPCIARSQRNYREGILIIVGTVLCVAVWATWIPFATFDRDWRDAAVPLGVQATGWAILAGILIPRSFMIVRGIARADMAQALPSLASLAFASNTQQYMSEQSIYECVNPAMRQTGHHGGIANDIDHYPDRCHSPGEIPTLPLRGASRKARNMVEYSESERSTLPASPNKATRF